MSDPLDASLREFLDRLADEQPVPGGGSAAAVVVAMAAGLVAMVARASTGWEEARGVVGQAQALRARVAPLAEADAEAYEKALATLRGRETLEERYRDFELRRTLERSAEIPILIAEAGSDLASLAALLVEHGNPEVRADAAVAAVLAEGGTRAAAKLVAVNLGTTPGDPRVRHVDSLVEIASEASARALAAAQ